MTAKTKADTILENLKADGEGIEAAHDEAWIRLVVGDEVWLLFDDYSILTLGNRLGVAILDPESLQTVLITYVNGLFPDRARRAAVSHLTRAGIVPAGEVCH